jgi:hypothetical protein
MPQSSSFRYWQPWPKCSCRHSTLHSYIYLSISSVLSICLQFCDIRAILCHHFSYFQWQVRMTCSLTFAHSNSLTQNIFSQEADFHDWQCKTETLLTSNLSLSFEIWHAADDSGLMRLDAVSLGEWFPSFQRIMVTSTSRVSSQPPSFRSSGISHPVTWCYTTECLNPHQHHCESHRSRLTWCHLKMFLKSHF